MIDWLHWGGQIIISQTTCGLVKQVFAVEPLTPAKTKGYPGFEVMYKVTGVKR